jgi:hypothetical protein
MTGDWKNSIPLFVIHLAGLGRAQIESCDPEVIDLLSIIIHS